MCCRYLPPDPGPVFPGEQAYSAAATGEGEDAGSSGPCSSSPTGTATNRQPSSPTTKEDIPSGRQPCAPAQALTCECMCESVISLNQYQVCCICFFKFHIFQHFHNFFLLFSSTQTSPKDEPKAPGKHTELSFVNLCSITEITQQFYVGGVAVIGRVCFDRTFSFTEQLGSKIPRLESPMPPLPTSQPPPGKTLSELYHHFVPCKSWINISLSVCQHEVCNELPGL